VISPLLSADDMQAIEDGLKTPAEVAADAVVHTATQALAVPRIAEW
jgi:hypothetical protein